MKENKLGKIFLWFTIIAAIFGAVSFLILDKPLWAVIGFALFIFGAILTVCIDRKYKDIIIKLFDLF